MKKKLQRLPTRQRICVVINICLFYVFPSIHIFALHQLSILQSNCDVNEIKTESADVAVKMEEEFFHDEKCSVSTEVS